MPSYGLTSLRKIQKRPRSYLRLHGEIKNKEILRRHETPFLRCILHWALGTDCQHAYSVCCVIESTFHLGALLLFRAVSTAANLTIGTESTV